MVPSPTVSSVMVSSSMTVILRRWSLEVKVKVSFQTGRLPASFLVLERKVWGPRRRMQ